MIVICDSSALINLSLINQLRLLENMFGGVLIPPGVESEVVRVGAGRVGAAEVQNADFIEVRQLDNPDAVAEYIDALSRVDAEVIMLAKEQGADWIVSRDRRLSGRARREGLSVLTIRALLVEGKQKGFIEAVKPLLDELQSKGVLIREGVYRETLRQAGELEE